MLSPSNSTVIGDKICSGKISSLWIAATSVLRGLPLLFAARPGTPLRVMCIMAFDALHRLRTSRRLARERLRLLAALLDFGASANAILDGKPSCQQEFHTTQRLLEEAEFHSLAAEYWRRLQELERRRPSPSGHQLPFAVARDYREEVVELSLGVLTAMVFELESLDDGIQALRTEAELAIVFRIVMQCQVIDDVVDYAKDTAAGLPSFLTAAESLPQALELTHHASRCYANDASVSRCGDLLPFRMALVAVSAIARLVMTLGR